MEDILISELPLFTGETTGTYILINNSGETETFKILRELLLGGGNINPSEDNTFTLGNESFRWKSISIGPGTLFITDQTLGTQAGLTVNNGVLLIDGANQLQVGQLKFIDNTIQSVSASTNIQIGYTSDTANLVFNRNVEISSGKSITYGDGSIQTTAYDPTQQQILHGDIQFQDGNDNITIQIIASDNGIGKLIFGGGSTGIWMNDGLFVNGIGYHTLDSGIKPLYYNSSTGEVTYDSDITDPFEYTRTVPVHSYGVTGDKKNNFTYDNTYFYICTADYVNNTTHIWKRISWTPGTW
jgi:hypothetical protein